VAEDLLFVGSYTRSPHRGDGISSFRYDPNSGKLEHLVSLVGTPNPSFLALHPSKPFLFSANEDEPFGEVSSYEIGDGSGQLKTLSRESSGGGSPCHICTDPRGEFAFVANHSGGNVAVFPITPDGKLLPATDVREHSVDSPASHAHFVGFDPTGAVLIVIDKGTDKLMLYELDRAKGCLVPYRYEFMKVHVGAAPRHLVFHPNGKTVFVNGEADCTISAHAFDLQEGDFREIQVVSTLLDDEFSEGDTTAEIATHPVRPFLYVSNRGKNTIAAFRFDKTGRLNPIGAWPTGGKNPRHFAIDPSGARLYVANQDSGSIVTFQIDRESGALEPNGVRNSITSPTCLQFCLAHQ